VEAHPQAAVLREHILDPHRDDGTDAGEAILRPARRLSDMFEQLAPFGGDIR
jgi:hypothetical protein